MQDDMVFDKYDEKFFGLTQAIELTMQELYLASDPNLLLILMNRLDKNVRQLKNLIIENIN